MNCLRATVVAAVSVGLVLSTPALVQGLPLPAARGSAKVDPRLCGVVAFGFTQESTPDQWGETDLTYGFILRNATAKQAGDVDLIINFYAPDGTLRYTERPFADIAPRDFYRAGGIIRYTSGTVTRMTVVATCRERIGGEPTRLPQQRPAGGAVVATDGYVGSVSGVFTNRWPQTDYGAVLYILRDAQGRVVGGGSANALETIPRGESVRWTGELGIRFVSPPVAVESNTQSGSVRISQYAGAR